MNEFEKIEKFLAKDPALRTWRSKKRRGWASGEEYEEALFRRYRIKMKSLGLEPDDDEPLYYIPDDFGDPKTGILVGYPVHEENVMPGLYLPIEELTQCHVGLWGKTRWGKSFDLAHLLREVSHREPERCFVIYDSQNEFGKILANLLPQGKLLYLAFNDYWKNPLQDVFVHDLDEILGALKRALMESQFIGAQSVNLLEKVIRRRCTTEKLSALGPPTLKEILYNIRKLGEEKGKGRGGWGKGIEYLNSLQNIMENISVNLNPIYNHPIRKGFTFSDFESRVVVIDISQINDPISLKFFVTKELLDISLYTKRPHPPLTILLDEMHRFAPLQKQYGAYSTLTLVDRVKTGLKEEYNFWFAEQNSGQFVDPAILANVGTHFVFRLPSIKDRWATLNSINVTGREQQDAVGLFEKRHCLVYSDSLGDAVLIKTPDLDTGNPGYKAYAESENIVKDFHKRFTSESSAVRETAEQCSDHVSEEEKLVVQDIIKKRMAQHRANCPLYGITDTYLTVGISPERGRKHVLEMVELGWFEGPAKMPISSRGHKTKDCYVLTEKGCKCLGLEWEKARLPGKGSPKSRLAARMIGQFFEKKGEVVRYEYVLSTGEVSKAADVAVLGTDRSASARAFEYQGGDGHLIENILRNKAAGFKETVVVCPNRKALDRARMTAEEKLEPSVLEKVEFTTLKEFVE